MSDRRFVTIVRAGDGSLYPAWLAGAGSRSCDIVVRYFGGGPDRGSAVLERVAVNHTRPFGESTDHTLRESCQSTPDEPRLFCKKHDISRNFVTHHAIDRNGRPLTAGRGHRLFDVSLFVGSAAAMPQTSDRRRVTRRMCKFITPPLTQSPYRLADLNATSL